VSALSRALSLRVVATAVTVSSSRCASVGPGAEPARHEAMTRRAADYAALSRRLDRARAEGDLPSSPCGPGQHANPGVLTR
jgi:hypothetical protein